MFLIARPFNSFFRAAFALFSFSVLLAGGSAGRAAQAASADAEVRDALFLILDTCTREQEVRFVPFIKTTPTEISIYLKSISAAANDTIAKIHHLQQGDGSLKLSRNPLPSIEQKARSLFIGAARQRVLFGTKGPLYVRSLLVDQIQESVYIGSLAQATSVEDTDSDRAETLGRIASKWLKIRDESYRLLDQVN